MAIVIYQVLIDRYPEFYLWNEKTRLQPTINIPVKRTVKM